MKPPRREFLCLATGAAASPAVSRFAWAQTYPSRPVRIIVGLAAGAQADVTARIVAQKLGQITGGQFVVENRPGGATTIATQLVAQAPSDGYALLLIGPVAAVNATLLPNLKYDVMRDFAPVALINTAPNILVVPPTLGVSSVGALVTLAKSEPDAIFYASSGVGTSPYISAELFNLMAGIKLVHVPYQGSSQGINDVLAGRVPVMFAPASTVLPHIQAKKLVALATTLNRRASIAPDLPTVSEAGLPGFETGLWNGLVAPAGTPTKVIDLLAAP